MPYGVSYRGDYGTYRGDPGLFGFLKKVGGGLIRRIGGFTPAGIGVGAVLGGLGGRRPPAPVGFPGLGERFKKVPGIKGAVQRFLPGGKTGFEVSKRRRMNVANPKALRRSIRRQAGFVKLARKALKGTGYSIVSRGAGRRRPPVNIMESGRGGVQVRT